MRAWCATLVSNGSGPVLSAVTPPLGVVASSLVIPWCLSCLFGNLLDKASRVGRRQRLAAELVHDLKVVLDIRALFQVNGPGELLDVDQIRQVLLLKAQDGK